VTASIYLDDKLIAKLPNGRYFAVLVEPGTHSIYGKPKKRGGVESSLKRVSSTIRDLGGKVLSRQTELT
jgi:hypothetical protein